MNQKQNLIYCHRLKMKVTRPTMFTFNTMVEQHNTRTNCKNKWHYGLARKIDTSTKQLTCK